MRAGLARFRAKRTCGGDAQRVFEPRGWPARVEKRVKRFARYDNARSEAGVIRSSGG
jgi:hypothetical protein